MIVDYFYKGFEVFSGFKGFRFFNYIQVLKDIQGYESFNRFIGFAPALVKTLLLTAALFTRLRENKKEKKALMWSWYYIYFFIGGIAASFNLKTVIIVHSALQPYVMVMRTISTKKLILRPRIRMMIAGFSLMQCILFLVATPHVQTAHHIRYLQYIPNEFSQVMIAFGIPLFIDTRILTRFLFIGPMMTVAINRLIDGFWSLPKNVWCLHPMGVLLFD